MWRAVTLSSEEIRLLLDASLPTRSGNRYRALVLEEVVGQLDPLLTPLSGHAFEVDLCYDMAEALNLCRESAYDLVMAGYRYQGIDGVSFLSRVRYLCPRARRFLVTDGSDPEILIRAVNSAGIHGILDQHWSESRIQRLLCKNFDTD